jgi:uncharacterized protein YcaQ
MQDISRDQVFSIRRGDLQRVADLVRLRIPQESEERKRVDRMRQVLHAAAEMNRSLSTYLHHALVDCHGTTGAADLDGDADALANAIGSFSAQLERITDEYRTVLTAVPTSPVPAPADTMPRRSRRHDSQQAAHARRAG